MAGSSAPTPPQTSPSAKPVEANEEPKVDDLGFIAQPTVGSREKGPFLIGRSDVGTQREITRDNFASVGIDQDTLTFDWKNDFKIPLRNINPAAVKFLTENEYGFSVSEE